MTINMSIMMKMGMLGSTMNRAGLHPDSSPVCEAQTESGRGEEDVFQLRPDTLWHQGSSLSPYVPEINLSGPSLYGTGLRILL